MWILRQRKYHDVRQHRRREREGGEGERVETVGEGTRLKTWRGWMESISRRVRMCAIIYAVSYPLFSPLVSLPRRGPLNNASHSSIRLLGLRSSTYDHSGRVSSLPATTSFDPRFTPGSHTASRMLITAVALIWVEGSNALGKKSCSYASFKEKRGYVLL